MITYNALQNAWCDADTKECAGLGDVPQLPTYRTIAAVVEKKAGSGVKLAGWTVARAALITPFMLLVDVPFKQAAKGSLLASVAISALAFLRVKKAGAEVAPAIEPLLAGPRLARRRY